MLSCLMEHVRDPLMPKNSPGNDGSGNPLSHYLNGPLRHIKNVLSVSLNKPFSSLINFVDSLGWCPTTVSWDASLATLRPSLILLLKGMLCAPLRAYCHVFTGLYFLTIDYKSILLSSFQEGADIRSETFIFQ